MRFINPIFSGNQSGFLIFIILSIMGRETVCIALSLNISILQLKLKKRFGETKIKKIWDCNKIEKKQAV